MVWCYKVLELFLALPNDIGHNTAYFTLHTAWSSPVLTAMLSLVLFRVTWNQGPFPLVWYAGNQGPPSMGRLFLIDFPSGHLS